MTIETRVLSLQEQSCPIMSSHNLLDPKLDQNLTLFPKSKSFKDQNNIFLTSKCPNYNFDL